jgi:alkylation response protein AidB-like acyl-CoA dehydrogenase
VADAITFVRTEEQSMLSSTVREFLSNAVDFDAIRDMSTTDTALDAAVWSGLVDMGLLGLHIPEEFGGAGYSMVEVALVTEELGRFVAAVPYLSSVAAATALVFGDNDALKKSVLPTLASGASIGTLAVYEGSHASPVDVATKLTTTGDGFVLSGTKVFVTDGVHADWFVVSAMHDGALVLVVVDASSDGITAEAVHALDATRPLALVTFDDVDVVRDAVIDNGSDALGRALDVAVVGLAAEQVGGSQRCMEVSVDYAKTRYQFGRPIGSFQAVKHKCADMLVAVEHARSAAWHAASSIDDPDESAIAVPLARSVCSDAFVKVAGDTIQVLGGIGFTWEHEAHLYFKRAKSASLLFGSVDSWRDRLADAIAI